METEEAFIVSTQAPVILVVEDNEQNLELTEFLLEEAGAEILCARDAAEMRRRLKDVVPDLVLMDIQLPGTDGLVLVKEVLSGPRTSEIPIVALTAHAMRGDRERFLAAGFRGYIAKPIEVRTFVEQVFSFLGDHGQERSSNGG